MIFVMKKTIKVALVDDHTLLRKALAGMIKQFGFVVQFECSNGKELITKLDKDDLPDIVLMDINMPEMDGIEATLWLRKNYPFVHVLALSRLDDDNSVIRMLKNGAKGYLLKDAEPEQLKAAINSVLSYGFYYSDMVSSKLLHSILQLDEKDNHQRQMLNLSEKEIEFLKLTATELTYKEIADRMGLRPKTVEGYRDRLFEKLNVVSRVGLVLFAIKNSIVQLNP
jgi:DNA-binding NarL/FixJ family response regulator